MSNVSPNNKAYWKKRFEILEDASHSYGTSTFRKIEPAFSAAERQIDAQIASWYQRFADNNQVTMQEARKMLDNKELAELKWDIDTYIKYGQQNTLDGKWMKQLENASAKFHISRLEALKIRTQQAAEVAFGNELDAIDGMARHILTEDYYHSCFEIMKGTGIGFDIGTIDEKKLERLLVKPWTTDGRTFSDRIWTAKQSLIGEVHTQLTRTCIQGKAPDDAIRAISKKFDVSKNQAGRLVMTEQAYFHSVAQEESFKDLNVKEFEIVATLDSHTSEICQDMDGEHYDMKDYEPGVTAPPFHPWCRSVTCPYFDDDFGSVGERAARDEETGKTYYVPANVKYPEWKKAFVDGGNKSGFTPTMSFMEMKELIASNEKQIEKLYAEKKDGELKMLTSSDVAEMEAAQQNTKALQEQIDALKIENQNLQDNLGIPTNAKERFFGQSIDYSKLPQDIHEGEEMDAVGAWTRTDYTMINRFMRFNDRGVRPESIHNAEVLKKMIDRNVVQEPFTVKRGSDFAAMNKLFGGDSWKKAGYNVNGKIITDKGFFATSPDEHGGFGGNIQMYVDVPKGAKGVYFGDLSAAPDEKEFLLQANTRFLIDRIEVNKDKFGDDFYDVYMKVIVDE